jgi:hypothetical protein
MVFIDSVSLCCKRSEFARFARMLANGGRAPTAGWSPPVQHVLGLSAFMLFGTGRLTPAVRLWLLGMLLIAQNSILFAEPGPRFADVTTASRLHRPLATKDSAASS